MSNQSSPRCARCGSMLQRDVQHVCKSNIRRYLSASVARQLVQMRGEIDRLKASTNKNAG